MKKSAFTSTDSHLFLTLDIASPLQYFSKEDVEAFLYGQEDEARHHGAQVVDDVVDALLPKAEDVQEGHDVALPLRQDLLQEGLLEEAPRQPGQRPVNGWLQPQPHREGGDLGVSAGGYQSTEDATRHPGTSAQALSV